MAQFAFFISISELVWTYYYLIIIHNLIIIYQNYLAKPLNPLKHER